MTSVPSSASARTVSTSFADLRIPVGIEATETTGGGLVLTVAAWPRDHQPHIELTAVASTAPLADASFEALRAARARHPDAIVVGADVWDYAPDADRPRAHRVTVAYDDVVEVTYVWATGTQIVRLDARMVPSQFSALAATIDAMAATLVPIAPAGDVDRAARAVGVAALVDTPSEVAGFPLPSLAAFAPPRFVSAAPRVSTGALSALLAGAGRSRLGAPHGVLARAARDAPEVASLRRASLVDDRGRLTAEGSVVARALFRATHIIAARVRRGGRGALLLVYGAPDGRLVLLSDPTVAEQEAGAPVDEANRHLTVLDAEKIPRFLSAWVGLTPFWPFADESTIDQTEIETRVAAGDTEVLVQRPGVSLLDIVDADGRWHRLGPAENGIHPLRVDPTRAFFDDLVTICAQALS